MSLNVIATETHGLFNYTECSRLTELAGCELPEKEFSKAEFAYIADHYGILA